MDERNGYIDVEGLDVLKATLSGLDEGVVEATMQGLEATGYDIINDAILNIRRGRIWTTGLLAQSGRVARRLLDLTIGFFDTTNQNSGYALYVEFGRRAGRMPPADNLAAWAYKKLHLKDWKVANAMGWAFARRIAAQGTQPHPFFVPAVNKNTKDTGSKVQNNVEKALTRLLRGNTARMALRARQIKNTPVE